MAFKNLLKMTIDDLPYYNSYNPIVATTTTLLCPPFYRALLDPSAAKRRDYWLETLISFSMIKVYICTFVCSSSLWSSRAGSTIFSRLDLQKGCYQIPMVSEDVPNPNTLPSTGSFWQLIPPSINSDSSWRAVSSPCSRTTSP